MNLFFGNPSCLEIIAKFFKILNSIKLHRKRILFSELCSDISREEQYNRIFGKKFNSSKLFTVTFCKFSMVCVLIFVAQFRKLMQMLKFSMLFSNSAVIPKFKKIDMLSFVKLVVFNLLWLKSCPLTCFQPKIYFCKNLLK